MREKRGLAYSVGSYTHEFVDRGFVAMYVGTRADNVAEACEIIGRELVKLRDEGVGDEELARAKEHVKGRMVLGLEATGARMGRLARGVLFDVPLLSLDEMLERVDAVSADEVAELGAELYDPARARGGLRRAGGGPLPRRRRLRLRGVGGLTRRSPLAARDRVGVAGAAGRMGETVCEAVEGADDMELAGRADPALGTELATSSTAPTSSSTSPTPDTARRQRPRLPRRRRPRRRRAPPASTSTALRGRRRARAARTCSSPRTSRSARC